MRIRSTLAGCAATALLLTACGGSDDDEPEQAAESASESPSSDQPSTAPKQPTMSAEDACNDLFSGKAAPLNVILKFTQEESNSQEQADRTQHAIDQLVDIAARTPASLSDPLSRVAVASQEVLDNAYAGETTDTTALSGSGVAMANECDEVFAEAEATKPLRPKDFGLKVKVTDKQCFGSAGCNVEFQVEPLLLRDETTALEGVTLELTYKVTGFEDGDQIGTITFEEGSYDVESRTGSTQSSGDELKARATDVSVY